MKDHEVPNADWLDGYQTGREDEEGFVWDWPEPLEDYGVGRYYWTGDDWKRADQVVQLPSYAQETFNNGMDLFLFAGLPLILLFLAIYVLGQLT